MERVLRGKSSSSFGEFVVEGNYVVGIVLFAILGHHQLCCHHQGCRKELRKFRPALSWMPCPGKQMAIDADLNAGLIDENQARTRRKEIEAQRRIFTGPWTVLPSLSGGRPLPVF